MEKKNKLKPSIKSVKYLIKEINKIGGKNCVYVGDNLYIDKIFAKKTYIYLSCISNFKILIF